MVLIRSLAEQGRLEEALALIEGKNQGLGREGGREGGAERCMKPGVRNSHTQLGRLGVSRTLTLPSSPPSLPPLPGKDKGPPKLRMYTPVLTRLWKEGKVAAAKDVWEGMMEKGALPNEEHVVSMVRTEGGREGGREGEIRA